MIMTTMTIMMRIWLRRYIRLLPRWRPQYQRLQTTGSVFDFLCIYTNDFRFLTQIVHIYRQTTDMWQRQRHETTLNDLSVAWAPTNELLVVCFCRFWAKFLTESENTTRPAISYATVIVVSVNVCIIITQLFSIVMLWSSTGCWHFSWRFPFSS